jgi:hypothetical protein
MISDLEKIPALSTLVCRSSDQTETPDETPFLHKILQTVGNFDGLAYTQMNERANSYWISNSISLQETSFIKVGCKWTYW